MGYTTAFDGKFNLSRVLTLKEARTLETLADNDTRDLPGKKLLPAGRPEMFKNVSPGMEEDRQMFDLVEANGLIYPSYFCQWRPTEDGDAIEWDGNEKFYCYQEWLVFLIETYFKPWGIVVNGRVHYQGDSRKDYGYIVIADNVVSKEATNKD